ncbi:uncharacterized protein [Channa argus]|uniref:uncharacterized protein isoform X4 n=1 Tax=Channa argus TaxID=215402 RepID=UPI0035205992
MNQSQYKTDMKEENEDSTSGIKEENQNLEYIDQVHYRTEMKEENHDPDYGGPEDCNCGVKEENQDNFQIEVKEENNDPDFNKGEQHNSETENENQDLDHPISTDHAGCATEQTSCLAAPTSASFYRYIHSFSSEHVQTTSIYLQHIKHELSL